MDDEHYRKLERMYHTAPCNAYYKPQMRIGKGETELQIPLAPNLWHAGHAVHGSVYFKAVDDSAFFATQSLVPDAFILTTHLSVYLTRPIVEGVMVAKARVTFSSRSLFHAESLLFDGEGKEIGRGTASFAKSKMALDEQVGYA